jgi:hypothetical protein
MDYALLVSGLERLSNLLRDRQGILDWQGSFSDPIGQHDVVDKLHDDGVPRAGGRVAFLETVARP